MNCYLTESNQSEVMALIASDCIKGQWQTLSLQFGKLMADSKISSIHGFTLKAVKAARYYW